MTTKPSEYADSRSSPFACPNCGGALSEVTDSRPRGDRVYRGRKCSACGERVGTYEYPIDVINGWKRDGKTLEAIRKMLAPLMSGQPCQPNSALHAERPPEEVES